MTNSPAVEIKVKARYVSVRTFFRGFHCWPGAPEKVAFLRNLHRHVFGVRVEVEEQHSDRDVEFFVLQADVDKVCVKEVCRVLKSQPHLSCEMMAEMIARYLAKEGYNVVQVEVDEDGENGARLVFEPCQA